MILHLEDQKFTRIFLELLVEEKVGPNLHHVRLGPDFLNKAPIVQEIKSRINKWDGFKFKTSSQQRKQLIM